MSQTRRQLLALLSQIGEVSHATLQQQLAVDGATVTRLVKQFESAGVLSRRLDPQDNRYTLVSLTTSGQRSPLDSARHTANFRHACSWESQERSRKS